MSCATESGKDPLSTLSSALGPSLALPTLVERPEDVVQARAMILGPWLSTFRSQLTEIRYRAQSLFYPARVRPPAKFWSALHPMQKDYWITYASWESSNRDWSKIMRQHAVGAEKCCYKCNDDSTCDEFIYSPRTDRCFTGGNPPAQLESNLIRGRRIKQGMGRLLREALSLGHQPARSPTFLLAWGSHQLCYSRSCPSELATVSRGLDLQL